MLRLAQLSLGRTWCLFREVTLPGRGANVEWNDRSVDNLENRYGDLCAVLESDADGLTFFVA